MTTVDRTRHTGWARAGTLFAACVLGLVGIFQVLAGIGAIADDKFFLVTHHYTFDLDITAWGWIHLILGVLILATSFGLFTRQPWASTAGIVFAGLSAVANFLFLPYYELWSVILIALDVWVIWALTRPVSVVRDST